MLLATFLIVLAGGVVAADRAIFSTPTFRVGDTPLAIAAGDLNRDGILDLVTANRFSDDLSIVFGKGGGLYEQEFRVPVAQGPLFLAIGRLNEDDLPDIVVASIAIIGSPSSVQVLLGNADGGFTPPSTIASGTASGFVTVADLDGDQLADLILSNGTTGDLSVRLAIGGGLFAPESHHAIGAAPSWIAPGDLNGDGRIDLVATLQSTDTVLVLLGDGSGGFGTPIPHPVGDSPRGVAIADFDSDGRPDLITANAFSRDLSLLSGNGDGTFTPAVSIEDTGSGIVPIAGDFDLDGRNDVAVVSNVLGVLWGRGDGTFDFPVPLVPGLQPLGLIAADLDGDGWEDLAASNAGSDDVHLFLGGPGRGLTSRIVRLPATVIETEEISMGDFDRDGIADFAVLGRLPGFLDSGISIFRGGEDGRYVEADLLAGGLKPVFFDIADFNGDGIGDLMSSNLGFSQPGFPLFNTDGTFVRFGHGDGTFGGRIRTEPVRIPFHIADFDGDGFGDLLQPGNEGPVIFRGDGQGHFSLLTTVTEGRGFGLREVGDMNGDGLLDLVVSNQNPASIHILLGRGNGEFDAPLVGTPTPPSSFLSALSDFNGDGHLDLALTTGSASGDAYDTALLLGHGDGTLAAPVLSSAGRDLRGMGAADFDMDGYVDLLFSFFEPPVGNPDSGRRGYRLFYGEANGRFRPGGEFGAPNQRLRPEEFLLGRIDGDALPDLAEVSFAGAVLLLNRGPVPDADGDGILDRDDPCTDRDDDGFGDPFYPWNTCPIDNCPSRPNPLQADRDADGLGDACDPCPGDPFNDADGDKHCGDVDRCPDANDPEQEDVDGDGIGDACDPCTDYDGDGFGDPGHAAATCPVDNCPATFNPDQVDADGNGIGDACEVPPSDDLYEDPAATIGDRPSAMASGDFNRDGRRDLAIANLGSNDVSILLGLERGRFAVETRIPAGQVPEAIVAVDLDRDGHEDLVVANRLDDDLSIFMGRGDGTFTPQSRQPVGRFARRLAFGDIDGDLNPDLVVGIQSNAVVLLGRGDGTFAPGRSLDIDFSPSGMVLGRFDADAHLDAAFTNAASDEVVVHAGRGDGSFIEGGRFPVGDVPSGIAQADVNGDGHEDLVTLNRRTPQNRSEYVSVLLGQGDGHFVRKTQLVIPSFFLDDPGAIAISDVNGDAWPDVITSDIRFGILHVGLNDGEGGFSPSPISIDVGDRSRTLVASDFTEDGHVDIAAARENSASVVVARGNGDGTFGNPTNTISFPHSTSDTIGIEDFDRDGFMDVAAPPSFGTRNGEVFLGIGDGTYVRGGGRSRVFESGGDSAIFTAVADFNRDGTPDIAVANSGGRSNDAGDFGNASVHLGDGDGSFRPPIILEADETPIALVAVDFNHDGFQDLAVANASGHNVTIHLGDGRGAFSPPVRYPVAPFPYWIAAGDLNEDGHPDLVGASVGTNFPSERPGGLNLLFGRGDGTFEPAIAIERQAVPAAVETADFDADGHQDLVMADVLSDEIVVLLGRGDGTFGSRLVRKTGRYPIALALGDVNADRRLDVVVASIDNRTLVVHAGAGDGSVGPANHYAVLGTPNIVVIEDLDGDHRPDLSSPLGFRIEFKLNRGPFNDSDGDGTLDPDDTCTDIDGDGFGDPGFSANTCALDNCPGIANADQADLDADAIGDVCDRCPIDPLNDVDRDDVCGDADNCPETDNPDQADGDDDDRGDLCDNCPSAFNPDQADGNGDGSGDACQPTLRLVEIREDGGETLEVIVEMSDPQDDPLSGAVRIHETLRVSQRVLDLIDFPDCRNGYFPAGVSGEGLAYVSGNFGVPPSVFDFRDVRQFLGLNCPGSARYRMGLGACDDPDRGGFTDSVSFEGLIPPIAICVVREFQEFLPPSDPVTVIVDQLELESARFSRDLTQEIVQSYENSAPVPIDVAALSTGGVHRFTMTASDGNTVPVMIEAEFLYQNESTLEITLANRGAPRAVATAPGVTECDRPGAGGVTLDGRGSVDPDPGGGIVRYEWFRDFGGPSEEPLGEGAVIPAVLPLGAHAVALRVTDADGLTDVAEIEVVVQDTRPPEFSLAFDPAVLWPPNHRMVKVGVGWTVEDVCDPRPAVALMEASSSEPDDAPGDGDGMTTGDIQGAEPGTPDGEILLRAERAGSGGGRTYEVAYAATDASGNRAARLGVVTVPHDLGRGPEPLLMRAEPDGSPDATRIYWSGVPGAEGYDVIAGRLSALRAGGGRVLLGTVEVLARGQSETAVFDAGANGGIPPLGEARFYLVQSRDGRGGQGFGTVSVPYPREPEECAGGCP